MPKNWHPIIDDELGLCYVRVPTWLPCRLQVYCNGHNWLALQMDRNGIAYKQLDNAFTEISSWSSTQTLSDSWQASRLHKRLDYFAQRFCPIFKYFGVVYHWSLNQVEYSTFLLCGNFSPPPIAGILNSFLQSKILLKKEK
jgi:hypothetical protein